VLGFVCLFVCVGLGVGVDVVVFLDLDFWDWGLVVGGVMFGEVVS